MGRGIHWTALGILSLINACLWSTTMDNINRMPYLTLNMLIDAINPYEILYKPPNAERRTFKWISSIHWERGTIQEKDVIITCKERTAREAMALFPESLLIVLIEQNKIADFFCTELFDDLKTRPAQAVIVSAPQSGNLLQKIQNRFLDLCEWQYKLNGIDSMSNSSTADVLAKSSSIARVPIVLYDMDMKFVAKSRFNETSPIWKEFSRRKAEILNSVSMLTRPYIKIKGACPFFVGDTIVSSPNGEDLYHLVALYEKQPTPGQEDLLQMISYYILAKSRYAATLQRQTGHETYSLFDDLIQGRYVGKARLDRYAFSTGLPLDSEFKLLRFETDSPSSKNDLRQLLEQIRPVNAGRNISLLYQNDVLVLLHAKNNDSELAIQMIERELCKYCERFTGTITSSQVFSDIVNLSFAYKQTKLASKYKKFVDLEREFVAAGQEKNNICYTFEDVLTFMLVDSDEIAQDMKDFAFSHSMLGKIIAEDAVNKTEDARILASYLYHERKATAVAEELHMHRNTVLYRIEKIKKRFFIDFDESWSRNRALLDFSILYCKLARNPELYKQLLGNHEEGL